MNFSTPTPIQAVTIPVALLGKDICACAATGTGMHVKKKKKKKKKNLLACFNVMQGIFNDSIMTSYMGHSCCNHHPCRPFLRVIDSLFFSLDAQVSTYVYHCVSIWTHMYSQWSKNIPSKNIDNVPFLSTKLSKYRVTCSKLAGELADGSKL